MEHSSERRGSSETRIAYLFGGFPYFSQTFNMVEIRDLLESGLDLAVYSMIRPRGYQSVISHSSFGALERAIVYAPPFFSGRMLASQTFWIRRSPLRYFRLYAAVVAGHRLKMLTLLKTLFFMPVAFHYARRMMEDGVTHVHAGMSRYAATYALVISKITGIPFSFTMHGPKSFLRGAMHAEKIRSARFITTISDYNRGVLAGFADEKECGKIHVIRIGIDIEQFDFREPAVDPSSFRVLTVARLDREKGIDYLLRAAASLVGKIPGVSLTVVGEGPERGTLEELVEELGIASLVRFTGALEHHDVRLEYQQADVFVLPSFWEGIPVVLMEAMASGVPVIATRITGIPELVKHGENGLLVPTGQSEPIATSLLRLYENPQLRRSFARRGRDAVEADYTLAVRTEKLRDLFTYGSVRTGETVTKGRSA